MEAPKQDGVILDIKGKLKDFFLICLLSLLFVHPNYVYTF